MQPLIDDHQHQYIVACVRAGLSRTEAMRMDIAEQMAFLHTYGEQEEAAYEAAKAKEAAAS